MLARRLAMNSKDVEHIKKICENRLDSKWMPKAQVMLRNIKPLKQACIDSGNEFGNVPIDALDKFIAMLCKKYSVCMSNMTVITDSEGGLMYCGGMWWKDAKVVDAKPADEWLFAAQGRTLYEFAVKACLLAFVNIKAKHVCARGGFSPSTLMVRR